MGRTRYYQKLPSQNKRIISFLGACTRIEENLCGKAPNAHDWQARLKRFTDDNDAGLELWNPYFVGDEDGKISQLRDSGGDGNNFNVWGNFLLAWITGAKSIWDAEHLAEKADLQAALGACQSDLSTQGSTAGSRFLNMLPQPRYASTRMPDFFPQFCETYLADVPGVKLLGKDSIEFAIFAYDESARDASLGLYLVVREARPSDYLDDGPGLVRDLVYVYGEFEEKKETKTVGVYLSTLDEEMYPLSVVVGDNWRRFQRPIEFVQSEGRGKSLELFVERVGEWGPTDAVVGLLNGTTRASRNPATWKVLYHKPTGWAEDLVKLEVKLDMVGVSTKRDIDPLIKPRLFAQLGPHKDGVIGAYPGYDSHDPLYEETILRFYGLTSFLSVKSARRRADQLLAAAGYPSDETPMPNMNRDELISTIANGWRAAEPTQFILKTSTRMERSEDRKSAFRKLDEAEVDLLFGRTRLAIGSNKIETGR